MVLAGLGVAVLVGACAPGAPDVSAPDFVSLHQLLYESPAFSDDPEVLWHHLARALHGRALTDHYVAGISAARQRRRDGVEIQVLRVDHDEVQAAAPRDGAARIQAAWSVGARVVHRGHAHLVVQRYAATFELREIAPGLRLTGVALREARRGGLDTESSTFDLLDEHRGGYLDPLDLIDVEGSGW